MMATAEIEMMDPADLSGKQPGAEPPGLPPNHPLLREAQETLRQQLKGRLAVLNERLFDSHVKAKKLSKEHGELGQQLFDAQQRLKQFQTKVEKLTGQEEDARKKRAASENELQRVAEKLRAEEAEAELTRERLRKTRLDYNELKFALQKAQEHTATLEDAIKLKRRQLYKDSETLRKSELQKMRQDFFLERLHRQLQEMVEQRDLLEAQIKAQEAGAQTSRAAVQETQREIEGVATGKRQLRLQLENCMHGLEMRSQAEVTIKKAIEAQEMQAETVHGDVRELERAMRDLQDVNETLTVQRNSTRNQLSAIQHQISKAEDSQRRLRQQVTILSNSLNQSQDDAKKAEALSASLTHQREALIREVQLSVQECNSLSSQILEALASQASITRAGAAQHKETKNLLQECETREAEIVKVEFEKAQLQVESVGVRAAIASLEEDIVGVNHEITDKENLLDQYQAEIRKGHILISRKQQLVDQLNREYDAKKSVHGEDYSGALDASIRTLKTQLAQNTQNITELQQAWIKKQTELISLQAKIGERREELAAKKDELLIRKHRNIRISGEVEATRRDIKTLNAELKALQHLVDRMGRQLAAFKTEQAKFENEAKTVEGETALQLAEKENKHQEILAALKVMQQERDNALDELVNLERQVLLWERKVTLEKEMQQAIDPSVGQSELTAMRKEIHRMELREAQLKKTQEQLLLELKQMLAKRDVIQVRNEPRVRETNELYQKAALQRQISHLETKLKEADEKGNATEQELGEATSTFAEVQGNVKSLNDNIEEAHHKIKTAKNIIEKDKVRLAFEKACLVQIQRALKKLLAITDEDLKAQLKPSVALSVHKLQSEAASVAAAIRATEQDIPSLQPALAAFRAWALHLVGAATVYNLHPGALRTS